MTRGERVFAVVAIGVVLACLGLAIGSVPGPWLSLAGGIASVSSVTLGLRANRRQEQQRQETFAARLGEIREGSLKPGDPSR